MPLSFRFSYKCQKSGTELRAEIMPDKASDAGAAPPVKADNEASRGSCRRRSGSSIGYSHQASASPSEMPSITMPTMTITTQAICPAFSFSFRKTRPRITEMMQ